MVGFIEPVGTSFQSASAERSELITSSMARKTRISYQTFFLFISCRPDNSGNHRTIASNVASGLCPRPEEPRPLVSLPHRHRNRGGGTRSLAAARGGGGPQSAHVRVVADRRLPPLRRRGHRRDARP